MKLPPRALPGYRLWKPTSLVGIALLGCLYAWSALYVARQHRRGNCGPEDGVRLVRMVHWQLEPGFREALDKAIADYHALPEVRARGTRIEPIGLPLRSYSQFINVHLIGGTAPDLIQLNNAEMINRNMKQFFHPLNADLLLPNPYNFTGNLESEESQPSWMSTLASGSWRSMWVQAGTVFGVPMAGAGTHRIFYNAVWLARTKQHLHAALQSEVRPTWLRELLADDPDAMPIAVARDSPALRRWAESPAPPATFGQLILLCESFRIIAAAEGREELAPIAAYRRTHEYLSAYRAAFLHPLEADYDTNLDGRLNALELHAALVNGNLSLRDQRIEAFFQFWRRLAAYFPSGFGGLDREQAIRRFRMGDALFMPGGSWDAMGMLKSSPDDPRGGGFQVGVMDLVVPHPEERWGSLGIRLPNELNLRGGLYFGVSRRSANTSDAIDFLRFLTSHRQHAPLIQRAGWLPVLDGVAPHPQMRPFLPRREGVNPLVGVGFLESASQPALVSLFTRYLSGTLAYPIFAREYMAALQHPRLGLERDWYRLRVAQAEVLHRLDATLEVRRFELLQRGSEPTLDGDLRDLIGQSVKLLGGRSVDLERQLAGHAEPFPEFN